MDISAVRGSCPIKDLTLTQLLHLDDIMLYK